MNALDALDSEDIALLVFGLDLLGRHTDNELAGARRQNNNAKQLAMLNMRQRIAAVRPKLRAMQVSS